MKKIRIAEATDFSEKVREKLARHFEVDMEPCTQEQLPEILECYDVFWFRLGFRIEASTIRPGAKCKIIATPVTGLNHIDESACKQAGIRIVSLRGATEFLKDIRATAEHTLLLTLALLRNLVPAVASVHRGEWKRDLFRGNEIYDKTVGVVGMGRLGSIMAGYFTALGARVIAYDKVDFSKDGVERVIDLADIARRSDIISLHLSLNESSRYLISGPFLHQLKVGSVLVNTSRGGIIDETALLAALESGVLAGAALDVLENEYGDFLQNPLLQYAKQNSNLIITPHCGGSTYESFEKTENFIADRIISLLIY